MTTSTASQVFSQLAALAASEVFPPVLTLVNSTLTDIETNPQEWVNPASAMVKGNAFVAQLLATLPAIENAAVPAAAQLISAVLAAVSAKLNSAGAVTPESVGASIGAAITGSAS
jgi:CO dehydrogenase/acetyl-CoA synthase delta subunit